MYAKNVGTSFRNNLEDLPTNKGFKIPAPMKKPS